MRKISLSKNYGIHTIELFAKNLKYIEAQKVVDFLAEQGNIYTITSDPYNIDRHLMSTYLIDDGIRLRISQSHNKSSGIGFIINPSSLLSGKYQPVKLWKPTEKNIDALLKNLNEVLKLIGLSSMKAKDLSLSQMDLTKNIWYDKGHDMTPEIRCFHKCYIPRHFKEIGSNNKETRKHLFVMANDTVTVKAYDKIYELKKNARCPESLRNKSILRLEVSMKREAFLKKFDLNRDTSLYKMLLAGYENGKDIIGDYLDKMFPFSGEVVQYKKAKKKIESHMADSLLKEQMLYLLKKTSDSAGLGTAVRKLKNHYRNVGDRRIKKIFSEFDRLDIAPITIPNN